MDPKAKEALIFACISLVIGLISWFTAGRRFPMSLGSLLMSKVLNDDQVKIYSRFIAILLFILSAMLFYKFITYIVS